ESIIESRNSNNDASTRPQNLSPTDSTTPIPPDETRSILKQQPAAAKVKHLTSIKQDDSSAKGTTTILGKRRASEDADDPGHSVPASKRVKPSLNDGDHKAKEGLTGAERGGVVNPATTTARPTNGRRPVTEGAVRTVSGASIAGPAAPNKPDSVAVRAIGHPSGVRPQWGVEVRGSATRKLFELFLEKEIRPGSKPNGARRTLSESRKEC
ncbi:1923_t:CDS:1, partial [Acaulospora colombiana]